MIYFAEAKIVCSLVRRLRRTTADTIHSECRICFLKVNQIELIFKQKELIKRKLFLYIFKRIIACEIKNAEFFTQTTNIHAFNVQIIVGHCARRMKTGYVVHVSLRHWTIFEFISQCNEFRFSVLNILWNKKKIYLIFKRINWRDLTRFEKLNKFSWVAVICFFSNWLCS